MITVFDKYLERQRLESDQRDVALDDLDWRVQWTLMELQRDPSFEADLLQLANRIPTVVWEYVTLGIVILAGGMLRRWIAGDSMDSDIDLFFRSAEDKEMMEQALAGDRFEEIFRCPEGKLTSFILRRGEGDEIKVQCVSNMYYEDAMHVIDTFDLTVSQFALCGDVLSMGRLSLLHLERRVLRLHSLPYPLATLRRFTKYARDDFWLSEQTARDFVFAVRDGAFEDGTPAGIQSDESMRWYID